MKTTNVIRGGARGSGVPWCARYDACHNVAVSKRHAARSDLR